MTKVTSKQLVAATEVWWCREFDVNETIRQMMCDGVKFMCWGAHGFANLRNKALAFHVNGAKFEGMIIITLSGADTYDLRFVKPFVITKGFPDGGLEIIEELTTIGIYCDQLTDVIDGIIET